MILAHYHTLTHTHTHTHNSKWFLGTINSIRKRKTNATLCYTEKYLQIGLVAYGRFLKRNERACACPKGQAAEWFGYRYMYALLEALS